MIHESAQDGLPLIDLLLNIFVEFLPCDGLVDFPIPCHIGNNLPYVIICQSESQLVGYSFEIFKVELGFSVDINEIKHCFSSLLIIRISKLECHLLKKSLEIYGKFILVGYVN